MAQQWQGKGLTAICKDIADGYFTLNPLAMKKLEPDNYKDLLQQVRKLQNMIRNEAVPTRDLVALRKRNQRLQRLHQAAFIIESSARERRIRL